MSAPLFSLGEATPIYKVGIVLIAQEDARVLIIRPLPKHPGEIPKFVLPRGSRQYRDASGEWRDARDEATAIAYAAMLEPLLRTLAREAEEEAGLSSNQLTALQQRGAVREMGARLFASSSKPPYMVHWFVAQLGDGDAAQLAIPVDASEVRWATRAEIQSLADAEDFSTGYLPVIDEALAA